MAGGGRTRGSSSSGGGHVEPQNEMAKVLENLSSFLQRQASDQDGGGNNLEQFRRMKPPSFQGSINPLDGERWIKQMEKIFNVMNCTDQEKVTFAVYMLEGDAEHWWELRRGSDNPFASAISWEKFKEAFLAKYFPISAKEEKQREFMNLVQGNLSVAEYEAKFAELSRFAPKIVEDEVDKVRRFEWGLIPPIKSRITTLRLESYAEAVDRALVAERDCVEMQQYNEESNKKKLSGQPSWRQEQSGGPSRRIPFNQLKRKTKPYMKPQNPSQPASRLQQQGNAPCKICGRSHGSSPCRKETGACFRCGKFGHFKNDCPIISQNLQPRAMEPGNSRKSTQGRVFAITQQDAQASKSVVQGNSRDDMQA